MSNRRRASSRLALLTAPASYDAGNEQQTRAAIEDRLQALEQYKVGLTTFVTGTTYTIGTSDPYSRLYLSGTSMGTVTVGSPTDYPKEAEYTIQNGSSRRWTVVVSGRANTYLWPNQSMRVARAGDVWVTIGPGIWVWDQTYNLYVDDAGSDSNDGLVQYTGALRTLQAAIAILEKYVDCNQNGPLISLRGTFASENAVFTKRLRGFHVTSLYGDPATPSNATIRIRTTQVGVTARDYSGVIITGVKFENQRQTATISSGTPAVVTATAHGFTGGESIVFYRSGGGTLPAAITEGTRYYVLSAGLTANTFRISTASGGAAINTVSASTPTITMYHYGGIGISASQTGIIDVDRCEWGDMDGGTHIASSNGGSVGYSAVTAGTDCETISGTRFAYHWNIDSFSNFICSQNALSPIRLTNACTFTSFANVNSGSFNCAGVTFAGAGAGAGSTGRTLTVVHPASISLSGVTLPGNLATSEAWSMVSGGTSQFGTATDPLTVQYMAAGGYTDYGNAAFRWVNASVFLLATSGVFGYGWGGTVTQATSKSTSVSLDKASGQITLNNAALAANTTVTFTLSNAYVGAGDVMVVNHVSGGTAGAYALNAQCGSGSVSINVRNITAGSLSEAIVIGFVVIKGSTS